MTIKPDQLSPEPKPEVAQGAAPTTGAGKGSFFMKDVGGGQIEGYFVDNNGVETRLTNVGFLDAEANLGSNVGVGIPMFRDKIGVTLNFKSLIAGAGVTLTDNGDDVTVDFLDTGEVNTGSAQGTGVPVFIGKVALDLQFRNILAGPNTNVTQVGNDVVIESTVPAGGGEVNTASNVGVTGADVFKAKVVQDLTFRKLKAGAGMTITEGTDEIEFVANAGVGEANDGTNVGSGTGEVFKIKTGTNLEFKRLQAGSGISIVNNANEIVITNTGGGGGGEANTASNVGTGIGVFKQKNVVDFELRSVLAGTGIGVSLVGDDVVIENTQTPGSTDLVGLTDTTIVSPANDEVLTYNSTSSKWENKVATGGGSITTEGSFSLGAGASIGARAATGLPAGWSVVAGDHASVDSELSGSANDLIVIHGETKTALEITAVKVIDDFGTGRFVQPSTGAVGTEVATNTLRTQSRLKNFQTDITASYASLLYMKLI